MRSVLVGLAALFALCAAAPAPAGAAPFAPLDQRGPALRHDRDDLRASLNCTSGMRNARRTPVLLLSGTTVSPEESFAWNWMPALTDAGFPWCASTAPDPGNMGDIQARGEYVVYAIRRMYRMADRRIAIYGHSQGGMVARWPLRFWPETRRMVSDIVAAAPSNRGTDAAVFVCGLGACPASFWQQATGSDFITALNSRTETFRRVSYTNVYSRYDQIVAPNGSESGRSALAGPGKITNVAVQDICPASLSEHLLVGTIDQVTWRLFIDAVSRRGPADPAAGEPGCDGALMPGIDRLTYATDLAAAAASLANAALTYPYVTAEPPLRGYVYRR
ncbi:MAG TPA: hypothetical protein VHF58_04755 [Solirubrobacterales bacterium]|nr:hypothetical protein [Solirubrobacterales bacterium]